MKTLRTLAAVGLTAVFVVSGMSQASAFVAPAVPVATPQSDVVAIGGRGGWRNGYRGYGGYRYYRPGYYHRNDGWWYPAGAFVAGALIGGAIANGGYYGGGYYYGNGYYDRYYPRAYYPERVYRVPRATAYRQGYRDGYRAGYYEGSYGGLRCTSRLADAGRC